MAPLSGGQRPGLNGGACVAAWRDHAGVITQDVVICERPAAVRCMHGSLFHSLCTLWCASPTPSEVPDLRSKWSRRCCDCSPV